MPGCCNCLSRFKPRYKRLVDNIYPTSPDDGLVRSNMEKLTYYAVSHNEKLNRIGKYLAHRLNRDIYRQQTNYVKISMMAVDELLLACHSQGLNLFVKSLLTMIDKLLEANNPEYQLLATNSFVKFANIEEDAPSYDRNYDFLISQFSAMCYSDDDDSETKKKIRVAGLKGLRGIVKKTVSDDLQYNIWEKQNMDKIIPSFLFNMQEGFGSQESPRHDQGEERAEVLAETCLRNLMGSAAYNNIHAVLRPVLKHLDLHTLWVPNDFAVKVFKVVMYSMQSQYLYVVPHFLLLHLDGNSLTTDIKQSIVQILKETVAIAAESAVGSSVLEIFNSLLRHLRTSVDMRLSNGKGYIGQTRAVSNYNEKGEIEFEEAIIDTMGAFASILPDYQKIEIMMFIMGKVPLPNSISSALPSSGEEGGVLLLNMLLKSLLEVGKKYRTVSMVTTFPASFLQPLLSVSIVEDPGVRLIVQEILHTLMDRHGNRDRFSCNRNIPRDISELGLKVEKPSRQDILFIRRSGQELIWHLYRSVQCPDNAKENYIGVYTTLGLLSVELGSEEMLIDLFKVALAFQEYACSGDHQLAVKHRCAIHALVARYLNLLGQLTAEPALCQHIASVIEARQESYPQLLPPVNLDNGNTSRQSLPDTLPSQMLFQKESLMEVLSSSGHDVSRLATPLREELNAQERPGVNKADINSVHLEIESTNPSPLATRKLPMEEITFASFKSQLSRTMVDNHTGPSLDEDQVRRQKLREKFQNSTLEQLAVEADQRNKKLHETMQSILDSVVKSPVSPAGSPLRPDPTSPFQFKSVPTYEMKFPELTVY